MAFLKMSSMLIFLSILIMSIASSSSAADRKVTDADIKQLCSKTRNPGVCYKLLKSDNRTTNIDTKGLVLVSIDLALNKANQIQSKLNSFIKTTHDPKLKHIYESCSKHYNDAIHDLQIMHQTTQNAGVRYNDAIHDLQIMYRVTQDTGVHQDLLEMVKLASKEIKRCGRVSDGMPDDLAHIRQTNKDFQLLLDIVRVACENLN